MGYPTGAQASNTPDVASTRAARRAQAAGIDKNTVNRFERDLTEPRPPTLRKLARALEVDPAELVE